MEPSLPRVFGPYYLLAPLGKGAAGAAYLAKPIDASKRLPPLLVVKCLHTRLAGEDEFVRRFIHEAEIAVRVEGEHIAKTFDVGAVGEAMYIALDYVPGWTLGKLLTHHVERGTAPPIEVACGVVAQAADGLAALHAAVDRDGRPLEAIHRDVSPKNVMVGDDGIVRVIDFGLGRSKAQDWKTAAGRVMGSPGYMPPEQIHGEPVDRRADVYALGVVLHELLVGARYIDANGSVERMKQSLTKPFVAPSSLRTQIPAALDSVVREAMEASRAGRTADAKRLADALRRVGVASQASIAAWVRDELPDLQARRQNRVAELSRMRPPDDEADAAKTRVFVQRSDLSAPRAVEVPMGDPVVTITRTLDTRGERGRGRRWAWAAVVALAVGAGFAGGAWVASVPAPVVDVDRSSAKAPVVRAAEGGEGSGSASGAPSEPGAATTAAPPSPAGPGATAAGPASDSASTGTRRAAASARRARARASKRNDAPAPPAPEAPAPPPSERARALARRLSALDPQDADTRARIARLLAQVSMIRNAPPSPRIEAQLDTMERDVAAMER